MYTNNKSGFIALISAIIIAGVLMMLLIGAHAASMYARLDALLYEQKEIARALAEGCVQEALREIALSNDPIHTVVTRTHISLGTDDSGNTLECTLENVLIQNGIASITAHASFKEVYAHARVQASVFDTTSAPVPPGERVVEITSWQEE